MVRGERGIGPVVHRPGAQLAACEAEAIQEPMASECLPGDPFAHQRIDDHVAVAARARSGPRAAARRSDAWTVEAPPSRYRARRSRREHLAARPPARPRAASPRCASVRRCHIALEEHLVLGEQPAQRAHADRPRHPRASPAAPHIVPALVRQPLHVVRHVACEIDDRHAQSRLRP